MLAAKRAKCIPVFIDKKYSETPFMDNIYIVNNLKEGINYILKDIK